MNPPEELPWSKENMELNEECLDITQIPIKSLTDSDKKQIIMAKEQTFEINPT